MSKINCVWCNERELDDPPAAVIDRGVQMLRTPRSGSDETLVHDIWQAMLDELRAGLNCGHNESQHPSQRLGDAPVQAEYHAKMEAVARAVDEFFNGEATGDARTVGFVLMVFPLGDTGRCNYMSNGADRSDIVTAMKEMIARFEGQPAVSGKA